MNKEKQIEQLELAIKIIRGGLEWEFSLNPKSDQSWTSPYKTHVPWDFIQTPYEIRIKPQPDPYESLKKAHAEGKVIQCKFANVSDDAWENIKNPKWNAGYLSRITPEHIKVPLGPGDIPPGSVFRWSDWDQFAYKTVREIDNDNVYFSAGPTDNCQSSKASYAFLMNSEKALINRSIPLTGKWDATAWEPCYKEVEQE